MSLQDINVVANKGVTNGYVRKNRRGAYRGEGGGGRGENENSEFVV